METKSEITQRLLLLLCLRQVINCISRLAAIISRICEPWGARTTATTIAEGGATITTIIDEAMEKSAGHGRRHWATKSATVVAIGLKGPPSHVIRKMLFPAHLSALSRCTQGLLFRY